MKVLFCFLALLSCIQGLELQLGSVDSACDAATKIIDGIMDYYLGYRYGGTVGYFQEPYYWWEGGLAFTSLIDTWYICNNETYLDTIQASIYHQAGPSFNYMILNQSRVEANDDQVFWGLTAMEAAERGLPLVDDDSTPSYLKLAQAVYNTMWERWDDQNCGGGLRWQIFSNMSGWDYKSTISNAGLFALGSRLGHFTNNTMYIETCKRVYEWLLDSSFIIKNDDYYIIYDGSNISDGDDECSIINGNVWSYNYGLIVMGCSYLYSVTNDQYWADELTTHLNGIDHYYVKNGVLDEYMCQFKTCNNDQRAFKAIVLRALGEVAQLVPDLKSRAQKIIDASASAAAQSCSGGSDGTTCGMNWTNSDWDGMYGLGEQISALEAIQNNVLTGLSGPLTENDSNEEGDFLFGLDGSLSPELVTRTHTHTNTHTLQAIVTKVHTKTVVNTVTK